MPNGSPTYEPGDEFRYIMAGAVIGWILGLAICAIRPSNETAPIEQPGITETPREAGKRWQILKVIATLVVFLAGPAIVTVFWILEVYVFDKTLYVSSHERIETLIGAMPIGVLVGFVASIFVLMRILSSSD